MERSELQKHTILLFAGDYEKLRALYPDNGAAMVVRRLIRKFLDDIEARVDKGEVVGVETDL